MSPAASGVPAGACRGEDARNTESDKTHVPPNFCPRVDFVRRITLRLMTLRQGGGIACLHQRSRHPRLRPRAAGPSASLSSLSASSPSGIDVDELPLRLG